MNNPFWKLFLMLTCCMGLPPTLQAQSSPPPRASVAVIATNLKTKANNLDGSKPIGSFEIHNNTKEPVMISGGYFTVSISAGVQGELWVQTSLTKQALHSTHLVYTRRGAYAFNPPAPLLVIPPGKMSELHVFLKATGPLIPSVTANAVTLETLHYCSQVEVTRVVGGGVAVTPLAPLEYNFEIRPKKIEKKQKSDNIIAAEFVFDNQKKDQNLQIVSFKVKSTKKHLEGKAELWVNGFRRYTANLQAQLTIKCHNLLMVKGVHKIKLVLKPKLKTGDQIQATLTNVVTKSGSLPAHTAFPGVRVE